MPFDLGCNTSPNGVPHIVIQGKPEAAPMEVILRMAKQAFPQLYQRVYLEMDVPENGLIIPELEEDG